MQPIAVWLMPMYEVGGGPIIPPAQPPGIWPSPGVPTPPIYYPPAYPVHPIAPGGPPPGIWPPPGVVTPPIYLPPGIWPKPPAGGPPPTIWPPPGVVAPPIYLPPPPPTPGVPEFPIGGEGWALRYTLGYGWVIVPPSNWTPDRPTGPPPTVTPH